jgi:hypothetical protein
MCSFLGGGMWAGTGVCTQGFTLALTASVMPPALNLVLFWMIGHVVGERFKIEMEIMSCLFRDTPTVFLKMLLVTLIIWNRSVVSSYACLCHTHYVLQFFFSLLPSFILCKESFFLITFTKWLWWFNIPEDPQFLHILL